MLKVNTKYGEPPFSGILKYCKRCCMPETGVVSFNKEGVCSACVSHDEKEKIDWEDREKKLRKILEHYKALNKGKYDCVVGVSGGKDSTYQLHVLTKVYGMKVLTVTGSQGCQWVTETGRYNLDNLRKKFDVDHLLFTPGPGLVNRCTRQSIFKTGDTCWHCHAATRNFTTMMALAFKIPLIIFGESAAEHGGFIYEEKQVSEEAPLIDLEYAKKASMKIPIEEMACEGLSVKDLYPYRPLEPEDLHGFEMRSIFLGDYIKWDTEKQVEFIKKEYDWHDAAVEGSYKRYKSIDCIMEGMHSFTKYLKRGYGRATDHASEDVRCGRISREEGFELIKKHDPARPKIMDYWLKITRLTEDETYEALLALRKGPACNLPHPREMII